VVQPAIGIAAAYGAVLAAKEADNESNADFQQHFQNKLALLASSQPTAINLFNTLNAAKQINKPLKNLLPWADKWLADDIAANKLIGMQGAACFGNSVNVLTHCNAGALATGGYGTALGVNHYAYQHDKLNTIYADETRLWNQGSRLTLWELQKENMPATLIADNVTASLM